MKKLRDNGLSLVLVVCFVLFWTGQAVTGFLENNREQRLHAQSPESFFNYLTGSHFWEATFENWESEFLQMSAYVVLTVFLFQRGSAESKDPDEKEGEKQPRKRRGVVERLYEHSLSLTLASLFLASWVGHALAGQKRYSEELTEHGLAPATFLEYLGSARLWFESLQNWQSEFLAVAAIVILSIWLREKGSPESKSMSSSNTDTGR